jgi:hypothetical protein
MTPENLQALGDDELSPIPSKDSFLGSLLPSLQTQH